MGTRPLGLLRFARAKRRLTAFELHARLRALDAGKLPPPVQHPDVPVGRKGRPQRQ